MPRPLATAAALLIVVSCGVVVSCGGGDKAANKSSPAASDGPAATLADGADGADGNGSAGMPAECVPAPYTVVAQRDGEQPAGSATFGVVGAAALPIPLVPNKAGSLTDAEAIAEGATTDLLGYVVFFGDEEFGPDDVSMFGGYAPETDGAARGAISIFPHIRLSGRQPIALSSGTPSTHALLSWSSTIMPRISGMPQRHDRVIFSRESQSIVTAMIIS